MQSADREGLSQGDEEVCECLQRVLLRVDLQAHLTIDIGGREAQGLEDTEGLGLLADDLWSRSAVGAVVRSFFRSM